MFPADIIKKNCLFKMHMLKNKNVKSLSKKHQINVYYSLILKNDQSPLHKASSSGHVDVVINLVANGAQIGSLDLVRFYQ